MRPAAGTDRAQDEKGTLILWGKFKLDGRRHRGTLYARIIRYRSAASCQSRQTDCINWGNGELASAFDPKRTLLNGLHPFCDARSYKEPINRNCAATAHGPYFKVAPLPRDRFALQGGKQFGVMSVDIVAEIRNAVIDPGCQIRDVNG